MWAMQYHAYGGPSVLRREEVPPPELKEGEVLVETVSSGISQIDLLYRSGTVRTHGVGFPKQPGFDALGRVRESRNPDLRVGAWVWTVLGLEPTRRRGTQVELLALDASRVAAFPPGFEPGLEVGSLPLGALTALVGLRTAGRLAANERVLVVGGAGAVGVAALQLVRYLGASADAVAGRAGLNVCADLGAERVVDHDAEESRVLGCSRAYDLVLVAAGRGADWLDAARPGGRTVVSRLDSWLVTLPHAVRRRARVRPFAAGHDAAALAWLARRVAEGTLRPVVGATYDVADLARAHAALGQGGTTGARLVVHG